MKKSIRIIIASVLIFPALNPLPAQTSKTIDLSKFFNGNPGAFVLYDAAANSYTRYNPERCAERVTPASTFKIPNSLIGLETGVIPDTDYVIKWDGRPKFIKEWERDHNLRTAIKYSVVPYYQELARRVGKVKMQHWLDTLNYGNRTIGNEVDRFWLEGSLKISPDEQIEFLKKFYLRKLPFSEINIQKVKDILPEERYENSILKFKTGTADIGNDYYTAWLVGYVEKQGRVYFFAFNIETKGFAEASKLRNENSRAILKYLKVLE